MAISIRPFDPADVDAVVDLSLRAWEPVFRVDRDVVGPKLFAHFYDGDWRRSQAADVRRACSAYEVLVPARATYAKAGFTAWPSHKFYRLLDD